MQRPSPPELLTRLLAQRTWTPSELAASFDVSEAEIIAKLESREAMGISPQVPGESWRLPANPAWRLLDREGYDAYYEQCHGLEEDALAEKIASENSGEVAAAYARVRELLPPGWYVHEVAIAPSSEPFAWRRTTTYALNISQEKTNSSSGYHIRGMARLDASRNAYREALQIRFLHTLTLAGYTLEDRMRAPGEVHPALAPDGKRWYLALPDDSPKFGDQATDIYEALDDYGILQNGTPGSWTLRW